MTTPRVSVIVPVRNRRDLLRRCLDALAAQTLADHEVVVVDDGSTDGADREAGADAAAGRPVRLVRSGGRGAVAARNLGVREAAAPVLAFTDSDCVPVPGWLAAGVAAVEGGAALAYGPTFPERAPRPLERTLASGEEGLFATSNAFYDRTVFEAHGGFETGVATRLGFRPGRRLAGTGFGEDTLLGWRVRRGGAPVQYLPEAVVHHHVFGADPGEALRRAWSVGAFPALVAEVPELRHTLLRRGLFLGSPARLGLYGAALAGLARRPRVAGAGLFAWSVAASGPVLAAEPSRRRALWAVPASLALDAVSAVALAAGSIRRREPVL